MLKSQHHIVAPVSPEHMSNAAHVINKIRYEGPASHHVEDLFELVMQLTESGLDFYFLEPLERIKAGSMTVKLSKMGLSSAKKGMRMVIHKALKKLSDEQLTNIVDFLEEVLFEAESS